MFYHSVLGVNVVSHQNLILSPFFDEMSNEGKSLSVAGEVDGRVQLVVRVLDAEQVELAVASEAGIFNQTFRGLKSSWWSWIEDKQI